MEQLEKKYLKYITSFKAIDEEKMIVRNVVASDGLEDRHGDTVNPDGWD